MLLDQANTLKARISHYHNLNELARHAQTFETRANQLQRSAAGLGAAVASMKGLKAVGIPIAFKLSSRDQVRARTAQLQQGFANDPSFIDDPGFNLQYDYAVPLSGLADGVKNAALRAWQAHVATRRESVPPDVLNALRAVPEYRPIVDTVKRNQEQIDILAGALPSNVANADQQLTSLAVAQREAWQRLTGGDLPPGVVTFLRASMGDGAELRLLTTEVIDWLKARKLDGAFRIKPRSA